VDVAWAQWSSLTSAAAPVAQKRAWAIVDPEALVLLSLAFRERERRLNDLTVGWARTGSSLLSVKRMNSLAGTYPDRVRQPLREFAWVAAEAGDKRWRVHGSPSAAEGPPVRAKDLGPLRLMEGPTLLLKLRAGFGVGSKADLLTFLLGLHNAAASPKVIAVATEYSERAIRTAAEEMALGGLIEEVQGQPVAYRAEYRAWASVLKLYQLKAPDEGRPDVPPWRFWSVVFAFLVDVDAWARQANQEGWSAYLASSRARDLMEQHAKKLRRVPVALPAPQRTRGAAYLDEFEELTDRIREWIVESL
jgi:hypothetical protein